MSTGSASTATTTAPPTTSPSVFGQTITQLRTFTSKPVLLSETAVGPDGNQFFEILDLFKGMAKYKTLGLVWFDKTQHGSIYHQDWRLEGNPYAADFLPGWAYVKS